MQLKIFNIVTTGRPQFLNAIADCCYTIGFVKRSGREYTVQYLDEADRAANVLIKEGLKQNPTFVEGERNHKARNWIELYTAYSVASLLDYAIGYPIDFVNFGHSGKTLIDTTMAKYAVAKIQAMTPLDTDVAVRWIGNCDNDEVLQAIKVACPGVEDALKKMDRMMKLKRWVRKWS
jgi:hypothetical protein